MYVYLAVCLTVCLSVPTVLHFLDRDIELDHSAARPRFHAYLRGFLSVFLFVSQSLSLSLCLSVCLSVSLSLCLSVRTISFTVSVVILLLRSVSCPTIFLCLFLPPLCRRRLYFSVFCWLIVCLSLRCSLSRLSVSSLLTAFLTLWCGLHLSFFLLGCLFNRESAGM